VEVMKMSEKRSSEKSEANTQVKTNRVRMTVCKICKTVPVPVGTHACEICD
jgi:hypothetical protein